jgi:hypothetical protein|tara:strand:- start:35 stop:925 length:891 start_codon:yes stop_codon:yes gene_type:complete
MSNGDGIGGGQFGGGSLSSQGPQRSIRISGITETVFPATGKGMPDVISYLDEVPWSTAADVKPMKKSVMSESVIPPWDIVGQPTFLLNPTTPYIFFSSTGIQGSLDVGINATDLVVTSADLVTGGMRSIVYINGPVTLAAHRGQIPQQLSESLGPFMIIDDEIIRYENPLSLLPDLWGTEVYLANTDDFIIPSVSERGMFGTTATTHLAGATIKELIVGYITGIEYNSNSEMVTIRTTVMREHWQNVTNWYYDPIIQQYVLYEYRSPFLNFQIQNTPTLYAFSVPRKQISAMGLGQ